MKKSISLLVVLALILSLFALVGCGGEEAEGDALTVTVVVSAGFGDKSFNDSAKDGADRLAADKGITVNYIECNNEGIKQKLMDAAEVSDFVVAVGWECYEIEEVAPEYPDTKFIFVDNPVETIADIPNLLCITYAQNEGSFLAGYIAAQMSKNGVVGAVGGDDGDVIGDFLVGYKQGAKYANPDIKVETIIAGDYEDPALGKECALTLVDKGADVIFNVAGNTGNGIFEAAQEKSFYAIGVDADQKLTNPEYDDVIICSMKKEVGQSIYDAIAKFADNGTWEGGKVLVTDMANGYISIAYGDEESTQQVPDSLKSEVEELAGKIINGEIEVETTRQ
ncbi:MAG: BMP family protein [Anaerovoracaceae bacterium]